MSDAWLTPADLLDRKLSKPLEMRARTQSLRHLHLGLDGVDFYSNDYLGMARCETLATRVEEGVKAYSDFRQRNGSTGSRLLAGDSLLAHEVEEELAEYFGTEGALVFNSGYVANTGLLSALAGKSDVYYLDQLAHASLKEGTRLSVAKKVVFRHNDLAHLEELLHEHQARFGDDSMAYVITEALFSMDGDFAPLTDLSDLCMRYQAVLVVDEAHTTGILGANGQGFTTQLGLTDRIPIRIHTYGKGPGVHGAVVCGSSVLKNYLINFSMPFIYTTATAMGTLVAMRESTRLLPSKSSEREQLYRAIGQFQQRGTDLVSRQPQIAISTHTGPVQYLELGDNFKTRFVADQLQSHGLQVKAVLPPTVPEGKARIRFCIHSYNTEQDIDKLFDRLGKVMA